MTTKVRIEKADQYPTPTMVQVQVVDAEGKWVPEGDAFMLQNAAQMQEFFIHQNKRLVVFEMQLGNA